MSPRVIWQAIFNALQPIWQQRSAREQRLLRWVLAFSLLAMLWRMALAPAWQTWQEAPVRQAQLDTQNQTMWQLQAQALALKKPKPITRDEALAWLESHLDDLGPGANISLQGERAALSVDAAPGEALAFWLGSARENALALPVQAQLQQKTAPRNQADPANATDTQATLWQGTLLMRLP